MLYLHLCHHFDFPSEEHVSHAKEHISSIQDSYMEYVQKSPTGIVEGFLGKREICTGVLLGMIPSG